MTDGPSGDSVEGACILKAFSAAERVPEVTLPSVTLHFTLRAGSTATDTL